MSAFTEIEADLETEYFHYKLDQWETQQKCP